MTFTLDRGAGVSASVSNDSRCLNHHCAPGSAAVHCKVQGSLQKRPRTVGTAGGMATEVEVPMHEQSIPTRNPARLAARTKLAIALCLRRLAARLELGATVDTLPPLDREDRA